jgi:hypothetical protein
LCKLAHQDCNGTSPIPVRQSTWRDKPTLWLASVVVCCHTAVSSHGCPDLMHDPCCMQHLQTARACLHNLQDRNPAGLQTTLQTVGAGRSTAHKAFCASSGRGCMLACQVDVTVVSAAHQRSDAATPLIITQYLYQVSWCHHCGFPGPIQDAHGATVL